MEALLGIIIVLLILILWALIDIDGNLKDLKDRFVPPKFPLPDNEDN